jgi:DNA-binding response OmpR family regulator
MDLWKTVQEEQRMTKTILVVDDDPRIRQMLQVNLTQEQFRVVTAGNGREALFVARRENPDVIILDVMMPTMGGYEFVRAYGKEANTPIIMLTAKVEEADKVLGLELGADDYVTKPFSVRELVARVRAVLRRMEKASAGSDPEILHAGDVSLDCQRCIVTVAGERVDLTPSEFEILETLMRRPGGVLSRLDPTERMHGLAAAGSERSVYVHTHNLRQKIETDPSDPHYIETVYGMGYRFASE